MLKHKITDMYDFDEIIDRNGSGCVKTDALRSRFGRTDLTPMWIADMDFRAPDFITDALKERVGHPVFGYTMVPDDYFPTISAWIKSLHGWEVGPESIRYVPGIVKGIALVLDCFYNPADKVLIQPPVYHPFRIVSGNLGHEVVTSPLIPVYGEDGFLSTYRMDFDGLERCFDNDPAIRVMILSNPHNPGGIAWDRESLERLADLAEKYNVLVISDEIHSEMILRGGTHIPFASVSESAMRHSITFQAPSKTFNIAGIVSSYAIVPDPELRSRFFGFLDACELSSPSIFSITATMAAYRNGRQWRDEMLAYVQGNIDFVDGWLKENLPCIGCVMPDASFLVWLDCRKLGLSQDRLVDLFVNGAGLALNDGSIFGKEGEGFMRMNVGCPRSVIKDALESLRKAITAVCNTGNRL